MKLRSTAIAFLLAASGAPAVAVELSELSDKLSFDVRVTPNPRSQDPLVHVKITDLASGKVQTLPAFPASGNSSLSLAEMPGWNAAGQLCADASAAPLGHCVNVLAMASPDGKMVETVVLFAKDRERISLQGFVHALKADNTFERTKVRRAT